ncbi:Hypothetical predicted protein [Cloeon dipterum]|uniref:Gustatory receptor n=1 Tax=Cloeon dipterum TaxID=197152 RepID=A0A8S1CGH8_9INSE|nr:Hypothetical predicted protein [Cloeon dipterum]
MFGSLSAQATFGRFLGGFPLIQAADGHFLPSSAGKAACVAWATASVAVAALGPAAVRVTFAGVKHFTGGVLWAMIVAAVASPLAVAAGLAWALVNVQRTAILFTKVCKILPRVLLPLEKSWCRLHPLVVFDVFRALGEALRLVAALEPKLEAMTLVYWVIFYLVHLCPLAVDLQIWALCRFLERGFQFVNESLKNLLHDDNVKISLIKSELFWKRPPTEQRLTELRRLHGEMRAVAAETNGRFGLDMLVAIVGGRLLVVLFLYAMVATVLRGQTALTLRGGLLEAHLALGVFTAFARVYALCHRFQVAASQAADALDHLQRLSVEKVGQKAAEEIQIFSMQVQSCPVGFTALGFFSLDIALISSIVGTVMTYLVILIQFESSDEK